MIKNENEHEAFTSKLDKTIDTNINNIILNSKGGFSADDEEYENKTEVSSIKPLGDILEIPKVKEITTEVEADLVQQNQEETEPKELTEEEKHAKLLEAIKQSHIRYHPKKQFGVAYKQKRKAKNKMQRKSRKLSRKK
ncbi:MAG: hypothetical protein WC428_01590 [Candidatus Paceibacterota bacterium]|jgi:hypothetical protein